MATRAYLSIDLTTPVSPTVSNWEHIRTGTPVRRKWSTTADTSTLTTILHDEGQHNDVLSHVLFFQHISDPVTAQTISGNITGQFQANELHAENNLFLALKVYVVNNDATSVRGTLLPITRAGSEVAVSGSVTNRTFTSTALSSVDAQSGDRIVIESGFGGTTVDVTGTQGHNGRLVYGCNASSGDLPVDNSETGTTFRPWVEFSANITFQTAVPKMIIAWNEF